MQFASGACGADFSLQPASAGSLVAAMLLGGAGGFACRAARSSSSEAFGSFAARRTRDLNPPHADARSQEIIPVDQSFRIVHGVPGIVEERLLMTASRMDQ